jgi:nondiscriminating aspartyl-tRNA synthetase
MHVVPTPQASSPRALAADLPHLVAQPPPPGSADAAAEVSVTVAGWVHRRRRLANVAFVVVRDRSGLVQVVVHDEAVRTTVDAMSEETVVAVTGVATANPAAPGGVEIVQPRFEILATPSELPPVELWRPGLAVGLPTLLDHADVTLRHPRRRAVFAITAAALAGFRSTLSTAGFTEINTPKIVGSATESGANVFGLDYFGRPAFLAQSPQFYKQAMVGVFERVFETGPVFRAEPHDTVRHLAEYVSLDAELGFIRDHQDVMLVATAVVHGMLAAVRRDARAACELAEVALPAVPEIIPQIHFADALELVGADPDEPDLAPDHERALGEWALAEHGSDFVYVTGYPMRKRPFYTHPQRDDPRWSNSFDLLFRGLELVTGGQRLHRYEDYVAAITARGEDPAAYASYLAPFAHGMPPHGGFAFGLERFVARLTGAANIRETTLFPRDLHRLAP